MKYEAEWDLLWTSKGICIEKLITKDNGNVNAR